MSETIDPTTAAAREAILEKLDEAGQPFVTGFPEHQRVFGDGLEAMLDLPAEVMRLRDVVEKLPKTADGVPVVPGMRVWLKSHATTLGHEVMWASVARLWLCCRDETVLPSECYSTHEAAEAARAEQCTTH